MNANLSLKLDKEQILPLLKRSEPLIVGLALIALFGYTAFVLQKAGNIEPAEPSSKVKTITFDSMTIESLKGRTLVPGQVDPGSIGKSDPFGN